MNVKEIDFRIVIAGIVSIAGIEIFALSQGVNGVALTAAVAIIAAAIGVTLPQVKLK